MSVANDRVLRPLRLATFFDGIRMLGGLCESS